MKPEDYNEDAVHRLFNAGLSRRGIHSGNPVTIGTIIELAQNGGYRRSKAGVEKTFDGMERSTTFNLDAGIPEYYPAGMHPREFAGPKFGNAALFPMNAMSLFVALGGVGKTTAITKFAAHIAAGKSFGDQAIQRRKALMFFVEETQEELNRKFGSSVHEWTDIERNAAKESLRMLSCLDTDPRLTRVEGKSISPTGLADHIISAVKQFDAELVFLDHLQGFVSGDLNNSDTATVLAREVNRIVADTRAAVVITAHVPKAQANATDVTAGFTTGSMAFENAARQVVGLIPLPDDQAKAMKLEPFKKEYLMMAFAKNSYGPRNERAFFRKVHVPHFHTMTIEPFDTNGRVFIPSADERLKDAILAHIKANPHQSSKNQLDKLASKKPPFKASRAKVRLALAELVSEGALRLQPLSKDERLAGKYPHQAREIYVHVE